MDELLTGNFSPTQPAPPTPPRPLDFIGLAGLKLAAQCLPIGHQLAGELRAGAYLCRCPPGGSISANETLEHQLERDRLTHLLGARAAANLSHSLDALALELARQRLADGWLLADKLPPAARRADHFVLGAQVETDATLEWLAKLAVPRRICRLCSSATSAGNASSIGSPDAVCPEAVLAEPAGEAHWLAGAVLALQTGCLLLTLALITLLLRIRKSRVSLREPLSQLAARSAH